LPWNFWVRDWREVHEVLKPYGNVTNVHGHTHQVLYNEVGKMRSIGMLATSWPWPYAPEGVPALTKCMVRADPGDHFDGMGWSQLTRAEAGSRTEYVMWRRRHVSRGDSGLGCCGTTESGPRPRMADQEWPYYDGAYK
jgi:hypothetical protein